MKNIKKILARYNFIIVFILIICIILYLYYHYKTFEKFDNNNDNKIIMQSSQAGFFACCGHILKTIVDVYNTSKKLPYSIDSSKQFELYKPTWLKDDITYHFFCKPINIDISSNTLNNFINLGHNLQYYKYKDIDYKSLEPFINKYFTPSHDIINIKNKIIEKYKIDVNKYCAVYYRGTDKITETTIGGFDTYIDKMNELLKTDKNIKFIIQSDNQHFIDDVKLKFSNTISFDENVASYTDKGIHNENTQDDNYEIMKNFLAIIYLVAQCKYIICSSGNCSIWMMYYRGHGNNVKQFLNNEWL